MRSRVFHPLLSIVPVRTSEISSGGRGGGGIQSEPGRSTEKKKSGPGKCDRRRRDGLRRSRHAARGDTTKFKASSNQIFKLRLLNQPSLRADFPFYRPPPLPLFHLPPCVLFFRNRPPRSLARLLAPLLSKKLTDKFAPVRLLPS